MSNMIDVLLIAPLLDSVVVCQPRPVPPAILHAGTEYNTSVYEDEDGQQYRIGVADGYEAEELDVDAHIAIHKLTPAWDLR